MSRVRDALNSAAAYLGVRLDARVPPADVPPERLILAALAGLVAVYGLQRTAAVLRRGGVHGLFKSFVGGVLSAARALPGVSTALEGVEAGALQALMDELVPVDATALTVLPPAPLQAQHIVRQLTDAIDQEMAESGFTEGKSFAGIYHHPTGELTRCQADIASAFINTNALYPGVFKSCRKMEAETVAIIISLLKGRGIVTSHTACAQGADPAPHACGLMTTGGTESVLLAMLAYRDAFLERAPATPRHLLNVICSTTAHPALDKACHYFGLRLFKLQPDAATQTLSPAAVADAIDAYTLAVYASAPSFPHGVVDPIPELAALAQRRGIGCHVDNCLGGVLLSFAAAEQAACGFTQEEGVVRIPAFDFRVPGVTTISCDMHKYGFAPKGASIIAFRDPALRRAVYTAVPEWPGGAYATPTLSGSRSGAPAAMAWATLRCMGGAGYRDAALNVMRGYVELARGVRATPHLRLVGAPSACILAFTTQPDAPFDIYALAARMTARGWHLTELQSPAALHMAITERHVPLLPALIADLRACVEAAVADPANPAFQGKGNAAIYGVAAVLPGQEISRLLYRYCDMLTLVRPATTGATTSATAGAPAAS